MNLMKIRNEDLIFENKCFEDRINTELQLLDYDWMTYNLKTMFPTKNQGKLKVLFWYCGIRDSFMEVEQEVNGKIEKIEYEYVTDIFVKYIIKFMSQHLSQWRNESVFNGGDLVIDFFNDVIEYAREVEPRE